MLDHSKGPLEYHNRYSEGPLLVSLVVGCFVVLLIG